MSHDIHVMPHDAIIESRKILKPSKVKEQKKKKKAMSFNQRRIIEKTRKKKKQKSRRRASVTKAYQSRIRDTAVAGGQINSDESFKATPCICIVQRRKSCEIIVHYLFKCFFNAFY
jgi:hypothetical protein